MTDREQRLIDALRRETRQTPPEGLADAIKKEIPESISSHRRFFGRPVWLIAATLFTVVGAGWLALQLIRTDQSVPAVVVTQQNGEAPKELSAGRDEHESSAEERAMEPAAAPVESAEEARVQAENRAGEQTSGMTGALRDTQPVSPPPQAAVEKRERPAPSEPITVTASAPPVVAQKSAAVSRDSADPAPPPAPPAPSRAPQESRIELGGLEAAESEAEFAPEDSTESEDETISYEALREMIAARQLPEPSSIDTEKLVNHFDYGDRAPRRRGRVSLFIEGGAAPFQTGRWRTVRIGIRSGGAEGLIGERAELEVQFDPAAVSLYRRVGNPSVQKATDDPSEILPVGKIPGDYARTWLYEVKLRTDIGLDQSVVSAELRYGEDDPWTVGRSLRVGHVAPTWSSSSTSIRSAVLIGALAENFGSESRRINDLEMLQLARELRDAVDADEEITELTRLIEQAVRLQRHNGNRY